jgi:branched-chain amino acid transport system permease protein/neutral amino acid transport system permease protein
MSVSVFVAYAANRAGLSIWLAMAVGGVCGAVLSAGLNEIIYAPFIRRGQNPLGMMIVSFAMSLVLVYAIVLIWGNNYKNYSFQPGVTLTFAGMEFTKVQLIFLGLGVAAMVIVHALLRYTRLGRCMRATASNAALARACGVRVRRVIATTWMISGFFCGVGGVAFAMSTSSFVPSTMDGFLLLIIASAILGGIGRASGAVLGAILIGVVTNLSALVINPSYTEVTAFVALVLVLLLRPQGILAGSSSVTEFGR